MPKNSSVTVKRIPCRHNMGLLERLKQEAAAAAAAKYELHAVVVLMYTYQLMTIVHLVLLSQLCQLQVQRTNWSRMQLAFHRNRTNN